MKRKYGVKLISIAMTGVMLAGCGSAAVPEAKGTSQAAAQGSSAAAPATASTAAASTSKAAETKASTAAKSSADDKTITFWNIGTDEPDKTLWQSAADWYNKTESPKSGYTVQTVSTTNDQYKQKLSVAMSAGECPDMYIHWTGGPMNEYISSGYAQDITDLMKSSGTTDLYQPAAIKQATYNGKVYAVPVLNDSVAVFFYDKKMWKEKGYEVPKTIGDMEKLCSKMVADKVTPFALANSSQWTGSMYYMYLVARMSGTSVINDAYAGKGSLENDATKYAGDTIEKWVKAKYFPEGVNSFSADDGEDRALLYKGAGMMLQGSWQVASIKSENPDFYKNLGCFAFPKLEGSKADQSIMVGTIGDNFVSFNCKGDKLKEAFKVAQYYSSSDFEKAAIAAGKVPPLKTASSQEPAWIDILGLIKNAGEIQLWWDQYLPASVAEVHKSATQKLFDCSATPEEVEKEQQDAMQEYLSEHK